ncbi:MAG: hypothetical protein MUP92_01595 [Actinobacteria bacterium]|nr:hypothetical protein [Actinomycetota bacterium]
MTKSRRLAFFALGICGGLVAGAGAAMEWQAVNIGGISKTHGTDTVFGIIALVMSLCVIIVTLATRKGSSEEPRTWGPPTIFALGAAITAIGGIAASGASFVYDPQRRSDAEKIAKATGATVDEILKTLDRVTGVHQGTGPWVVVAGGLVIVGAAVAGFAWWKAWRNEDTTSSADADSGADGTLDGEDPPPGS